MEVPELKSPQHDNGGPLKLQTGFPSYCGSAAEMDWTWNSSKRIAAGASALWIGQGKETCNLQREL